MVSSHSKMLEEVKLVGRVCAAQWMSPVLSKLHHISAVFFSSIRKLNLGLQIETSFGLKDLIF